MATEDRTFVESNLCSLRARPQVLTALIISLLREQFASADNIEHDALRARLYVDGDSTGILIEDSSVWTPGKAGKRPAILVKRNAWQQQPSVVADAPAGTTDDGDPQYFKLWRGSHSVLCVGKSGVEAELLATEVYRYLMHFGPVIRDYCALLQFEVVDVGPATVVEEANQYFAVPIGLSYGWDECWTVREWAGVIVDTRIDDVFDEYYGEEAL